MKFSYVMASALIAAAASFASVRDLYFNKNGDGKFCVDKGGTGIFVDASGKSCSPSLSNDVRIRVINAVENSSQKFGFDIERPFLILDGIYLSPDGRRTLSELHDETNKFGMASLLSGLGYTPILVQFAETVERSLEDNAKNFTDLLKFINDNKLFGFANRKEDGFVILGISQGGILGRYGAYKYDVERTSSDAPVRLYASMDSPHQGAVMPKGLFYTINFWATSGGSAAAEAFGDMIEGPGARGLLITQSVDRDAHQNLFPLTEIKRYKENINPDRFLYGEYRKAAEYKGFPSVLISQGQLKGSSPAHAPVYFKLNRKAEKLGMIMGRATSRFSPTVDQVGELAYNRVYEKTGENAYSEQNSLSKYDFVQGSTYPFAKTMYESLREGFLDAMPKNMEVTVAKIFGLKASLSIATSWDEDVLYQENSTFIPTTSAMDLKCDGKLSITEPCAFNQSSTGVNFENPGSRSSAMAAYAVDPSHPRYKEAISGRHIEIPDAFSKKDSAIIRGMQVDIWRVLCEAAKLDYDKNLKKYRNPNFTEHFQPGASCMDVSKIPEIVKNAGMIQTKSFAYARYDYDKQATESNKEVAFDLAAGWHKVAIFDNGTDIPEGSAFEVDVQVDSPRGSWMKAELLLHRVKGGVNQLQLTEVPVIQDGKRHTIRWQMPFSNGALTHYRWFRLVLNSDGGKVKLSNPRLVQSGIEMTEPETIKSSVVYPNGGYTLSPWSSSTAMSFAGGPSGNDLNLEFANHGSGLYVQFGSWQSLKPYSKLKVEYVPGTCLSTGLYFDSFKNGASGLANGALENGMAVTYISLDKVIDTQLTPNFSKSASKLAISSKKAGERCVIRKISLE